MRRFLNEDWPHLQVLTNFVFERFQVTNLLAKVWCGADKYHRFLIKKKPLSTYDSYEVIMPL